MNVPRFINRQTLNDIRSGCQLSGFFAILSRTHVRERNGEPPSSNQQKKSRRAAGGRGGHHNGEARRACNLRHRFPVQDLHSLRLSYLHLGTHFHLLDIAPPLDLLKPLLPPNSHLKSLQLACDRLDDSAIDLFLQPSLQELCLHNCTDFTDKLLSEIGGKCGDLRYLCLGSVAEKRGRAIHISDLEG